MTSNRKSVDFCSKVVFFVQIFPDKQMVDLSYRFRHEDPPIYKRRINGKVWKKIISFRAGKHFILYYKIHLARNYLYYGIYKLK